jgi:hypothetical protein
MALTPARVSSSRSNSVWDLMAHATRGCKKDVGRFQSDTDAEVSMSAPKGDIAVLPLSAGLQVSVLKDRAAAF